VVSDTAAGVSAAATPVRVASDGRTP
jgi:hypothetical protein